MKTLFALVLCIQAYLVLSDGCSPNPCLPSTTCCPANVAGFPDLVGCCPAPNAVCCSDKKHCCPQNTVCNLDKGTCDNETVSIPFRKQELVGSVAMKKAKRVNDVLCPDGVSRCPDGTTCCKLFSSRYGCCPYLYPVCCIDGMHCCANGTVCDPTSSFCQPSSFGDVAPTRKRKPALSLPIAF